MFAVIKCGGKQYKASPNAVIKTEKISGEIGEKVQLGEVLMIQDSAGKVLVGAPVVEGAYVTAEIINQTRDPKIIIFKKKRRQNYRRKAGHKQHVTFVRVLEVKSN